LVEIVRDRLANGAVALRAHTTIASLPPEATRWRMRDLVVLKSYVESRYFQKLSKITLQSRSV
jgi:hypothetical protein